MRLRSILLALLLSLTALPVWADMYLVNNGAEPIDVSNPGKMIDTAKIESETTGLSPTVLALAIKAYQTASSEGLDRQKILTIVDFSKPSTEKRMWVIDLANNTVLYHTLVAHGDNSGGNEAVRFSNKNGSHESSLGLYVTGKPYYGHLGYSMRIYGITPGFNTNAFYRDIVVHGAWYVSEQVIKQYGHLGYTWGCFGLNPHIVRNVIHSIEGGSLIFAYYPDQQWLENSPFLRS